MQRVKGDKIKRFKDEDNLWMQKYIESRDTRYLGKLYERYKQKIFIQCLQLVKNTEEAKDLTSETFIRAFGHIEKFKPGSPFLPWLSRIATNLCIDYLRKQSRFRFEPFDEHRAITNSHGNENANSPSHLRNKILRAIQNLKQPQRRCFCLFYVHDFSYKEIAEITGFTFDHVRSHIQNGRRRFKIFMEES